MEISFVNINIRLFRSKNFVYNKVELFPSFVSANHTSSKCCKSPFLTLNLVFIYIYAVHSFTFPYRRTLIKDSFQFSDDAVFNQKFLFGWNAIPFVC